MGCSLAKVCSPREYETDTIAAVSFLLLTLRSLPFLLQYGTHTVSHTLLVLTSQRFQHPAPSALYVVAHLVVEADPADYRAGIAAQSDWPVNQM